MSVKITDRKQAIDELLNGNQVFIRAAGKSMTGIIADKSIVKIIPISESKQEVQVGHAVFCRINGNLYVHKCTGIRTIGNNKQFQISNNFNHVNGWTSQVFGIAEQYNG